MNEPKKRECGSCTMCCKLLNIVDPELTKPAYKWCQHCDIGKGCKIYSTRPEACKAFECLWLQDRRGVFPDDARPDKSGVVLRPTPVGGVLAHCDKHRPERWRKLLPRLRRLAMEGYPVGAEAGGRYWVITGKTEWEAPKEYQIDHGNGFVDIRIPKDIAMQIGYKVRSTLKLGGPFQPE